MNYTLSNNDIQVCGNRIKSTNVLYKAYGWILSIILSSLLFFTTFRNIHHIFQKYNSLSLTVTYSLSVISIFLSFVFIQADRMLYGFQYIKNLYVLLLRIDLKIQNEHQQYKDIIETSRLIHCVYFFFKSVHIVVDYFCLSTNVFPLHICHIIMDLQIIRFVLEVNLVARKFETLNQLLSVTNSTNPTKTFLEESDRLLIRFWRTSIKKFDKRFLLVNRCNEKLFFAYNELSMIMENLNSRYSLMVG